MKFIIRAMTSPQMYWTPREGLSTGRDSLVISNVSVPKGEQGYGYQNQWLYSR
jgi:hypothetical protein